jgi:hypothetical protein
MCRHSLLRRGPCAPHSHMPLTYSTQVNFSTF